MESQRRAELLDDAFLRPPSEIGGMTLRPLSAASFIVLKRAGNPLVAGNGSVDLDSATGLLAAFEFIYVHAAPLPEVLRTSRLERAEFEDMVLAFAAAFPTALIGQAVKAITGEIETAAAGIAEPEPPDNDEEGDDPNGRRRRGSTAACSQSPVKPGGRRRS